MSEMVWVLIAVLVVAAVIVIGWSLSRRRRSARLQQHFGPEYERTVGELGEQRAAEAELVADNLTPLVGWTFPPAETASRLVSGPRGTAGKRNPLNVS